MNDVVATEILNAFVVYDMLATRHNPRLIILGIKEKGILIKINEARQGRTWPSRDPITVQQTLADLVHFNIIEAFNTSTALIYRVSEIFRNSGLSLKEFSGKRLLEEAGFEMQTTLALFAANNISLEAVKSADRDTCMIELSDGTQIDMATLQED